MAQNFADFKKRYQELYTIINFVEMKKMQLQRAFGSYLLSHTWRGVFPT